MSDDTRIDVVVTGTCGALCSLAFLLERLELLDRRELVTALKSARNNAEKQEGGPTERTMVVDKMLATLEGGAEARKRFRLINGGAETSVGDGTSFSNDPEPPEAA
jgi:hypothetical protein